jgi:hypothetical protein
VDPFPVGYVLPKVDVLRAPAFVFWGAGNSASIPVAILGVLAVTLVIGNVLSLRGVMTGPQVGLALLVVSALLHQGLIAALIGSALVLRYGVRTLLLANENVRFS